jgi:hypothetical protein
VKVQGVFWLEIIQSLNSGGLPFYTSSNDAAAEKPHP